MLREEQVVGVGPVDAADLVDVAKAFGDQQRGVGAGALQQRVDGDGRAVQEQVGVLHIQPGAVQRVLDAVDEVCMRGQGLAEMQRAGALVERRQIGEGAADVDGDAQGSFWDVSCVPFWLAR